MLGFVYIFVGSRLSTKLTKLRQALPDNAAIVAAFRHVAPDGRPLNFFSLRLVAQAAGVPLRWQFEHAALLHTLDLDRDGLVTEDDLIYWLGEARPDVVPRADVDAEELADVDEDDAASSSRAAVEANATAAVKAAVAAAAAADVEEGIELVVAPPATTSAMQEPPPSTDRPSANPSANPSATMPKSRNLADASHVSEAQRAAAVCWAQQLLDDKAARLAYARKTFASVDFDGSGTINEAEAFALVERFAHETDLPLPPAEKINTLLFLCDTSGDGELQVGEFLSFF